MNDNNISLPERRKHPRLYVGQNVIGATMPGYINMGRMIDISRSGLSFNYINEAITVAFNKLTLSGYAEAEIKTPISNDKGGMFPYEYIIYKTIN